jgi:hypothetical protein
MLRSQRALLVIAAGAALVAGGCGKPPPPKVDAATERAEALERAKARAYGGEAVKALEKAKGLGADMDQKARDAVEKAEKQ